MSSLAEIEAAAAELAVWHEYRRQGLTVLPFGTVNWTYDGDAHVPASERLPAIAMGINPGSGNGATEPRFGPGEAKWRTNCVKLTGVQASQIVFAELVSISTRSLADLEGGLNVEEGIGASARLNTAIIDYHQPEAVYQLGFLVGSLEPAIRIYGLKQLNVVPRPGGDGRLLVHYKMLSGVNWLSIRHFAAPGFSNEDFAAVRRYVASL